MARRSPPVEKQIAAGQEVPARRTGARRFLAYFQAYANTCADVEALRRSYDKAIACRIRCKGPNCRAERGDACRVCTRALGYSLA